MSTFKIKFWPQREAILLMNPILLCSLVSVQRLHVLTKQVVSQTDYMKTSCVSEAKDDVPQPSGWTVKSATQRQQIQRTGV